MKESIITNTPAVFAVLHMLHDIAQTDVCVLLRGEAGCGKELFARWVHENSSRPELPFVHCNCLAPSVALFESYPAGSTIFLDEVGCLPPSAQEEVLAALRERRNGVRYVAATRQDLDALLQAGTFLPDLYHRLQVMPVSIPPLRARRDDIPSLATHFLHGAGYELKKTLDGFSPAALQTLCGYRWPGNVRELKNVVEHAAIVCADPQIQAADLQLPLVDRTDSCVQDVASSSDRTLRHALTHFKRQYLTEILASTNWNESAAARILDVQRTYLCRLLGDLQIKRGP